MIRLVKKERSWTFAVTVTAVVAMVIFGMVGYSSVCTRCGMKEQTVGWQFPLIPVTLAKVWWSSETPMSAVVERTGLVGKHEHEWCFIHGSGNGATCMLGNSGKVAFVAGRQETALLLEECVRFGDRELAERMVKVMLDPRTAEVARMVIFGVPDGGFADAAAFAVWKVETLAWLEEELVWREEERVRDEAAAERGSREWKYREAQGRDAAVR